MDVTAMGKQGLTGWRGKVGSKVAEPVAARTSLSQEQVEALIGGGVLAVVPLAVHQALPAGVPGGHVRRGPGVAPPALEPSPRSPKTSPVASVCCRDLRGAALVPFDPRHRGGDGRCPSDPGKQSRGMGRRDSRRYRHDPAGPDRGAGCDVHAVALRGFGPGLVRRLARPASRGSSRSGGPAGTGSGQVLAGQDHALAADHVEPGRRT